MPTVSLPDGELYYETQGEGPPLVCLHGGWQHGRSWRPQIERFADEYTVVTVDIRGHGRTGSTDTRRYSVSLFVDDLERLLAHLGIRRPLLCGISLGGMILQSYLDRHPDSARGVVIGGPLQSMPPVDLPTGLKPFVSPVPAVSGMLSTMGSVATFRSLCESIRATTDGPWLTVDPDVRSRSLEAVRDVPRNEYLKIFRALYRFEPPELSDVRTPALILYGDGEAASVKRQADRLAETLTNGTGREIPDAGHLLNQDNAQAFDEACSAFFADLDPAVDGTPS